MVGSLDEVLAAWQIIQEEAAKAGLKVNKGKCDLIPPEGWQGECPEELKCVKLGNPSGFDLLGAPIGDKQFCEDYVRERVAKIKAALENLEMIDDPQVEMLLLRSCLGFPKFVFSLRSAPPEDIAETIREFDKMISSTMQERLGISLTQEQEKQARLPVAMGGLGIERAEDVAESAYLGNVLATRKLVSTLLGEKEPILGELKGVERALEAWKDKTGVEVRHVENLLSLKEMKTKDGMRHPQRVLASFVHHRVQMELLANAPNSREELRLRAVAREDAGAWLSVLPVRQLGLKFDQDEYLALMKWWLGVSIYTQPEKTQFVCPEGACKEKMDIMSDHAATCKFGPSRIARHDGVNKAWAFAVKGAGMAVKMEVYTDPETMHRSADTLVDGWEFGRSAAHDWVVSHTLQKAALEAGKGRRPNFTLEQSERRKDSYAKRRCEMRGLDFVPLAMDTFGGVGERAKKAISIVVANARIFRGNALYDRNVSRRGLTQRMQVAVMRGVARQLLRRLAVEEEEGGMVGWQEGR